MSSLSSSVSRATYCSWIVSQASLMRPNCVEPGEDAGFGVDEEPLLVDETTAPPTPIPALNVATNARPTTAPAIPARRPRPAAGDVEAWEGPGVREVTSGGSWSVVGSVEIRVGSIGGI